SDPSGCDGCWKKTTLPKLTRYSPPPQTQADRFPSSKALTPPRHYVMPATLTPWHNCPLFYPLRAATTPTRSTRNFVLQAAKVCGSMLRQPFGWLTNPLSCSTQLTAIKLMLALKMVSTNSSAVIAQYP